jgi:hypothetical protein
MPSRKEQSFQQNTMSFLPATQVCFSGKTLMWSNVGQLIPGIFSSYCIFNKVKKLKPKRMYVRGELSSLSSLIVR